MILPEEYKKRIEELLGDEAEEYFRSLDLPRVHGFRANTVKINRDELKKILPKEFNAEEEVPWCDDGLYYSECFPGRHPFYHAGLYYIQEPSAMFPGATIKAQPGERVLDICAAPGGKSVQLAGSLGGRGLLFSNDISEERVKALVKNLEMAGVKNAVILNESPENLAKNFNCYFDRILVDAPCSGEGMFRKDETAVKSWQNFKTDVCRSMQDDILKYCDMMLKPGGRLLYSTCTFSPLEDEYSIGHFMETTGNYEIEEIKKCGGISDGLFGMDKAARLWPHRLKGEGHFTVLLRKKGETTENKSNNPVKCKSFKILKETPQEIERFFESYCREKAWEGVYFTMGDNVYYLPEMPPVVDGLKVARVGLFMGNIMGGKFKPSHPFAMAAGKDLFKENLDFEPDSEELERYLKGETLSLQAKKGYAAVRCKGYIVGLVFGQDGAWKNLYPKGWRRTC